MAQSNPPLSGLHNMNAGYQARYGITTMHGGTLVLGRYVNHQYVKHLKETITPGDLRLTRAPVKETPGGPTTTV